MKIKTHPFSLGKLVITSEALAKLNQEDTHAALARHKGNDWGKLDAEDWKSNDAALRQGHRVLSAYTDRNDTRFWIITEHDRSVTTILLPEDY